LDVRKAVRQKTSDNLLRTIHHIPIECQLELGSKDQKTLVAHQYETVAACSSRLYHMLESTTKDGWQHASNMPSNVRTVTSPAKFLQAA
jgi:hypothetical protein